jgi:hypothetical protein
MKHLSLLLQRIVKPCLALGTVFFWLYLIDHKDLPGGNSMCIYKDPFGNKVVTYVKGQCMHVVQQ